MYACDKYDEVNWWSSDHDAMRMAVIEEILSNADDDHI